MELLFKLFASAVVIGIAFVGLRWIWTSQIDVRATINKASEKIAAPPEWLSTRDPSKIYQNDHAVGDVTGPVERTPQSLLFTQLANTNGFKADQPLEYRRLKLHVSRIQRSIGMKIEGRHVLSAVLEGVACDIVE